MNENETVNLLWTSGWDSTFRLLTLVLEQGKTVQPYYVFDKGRPSSIIELQAQEQIKNAVARRSKTAAGLILPTIVAEEENVPEYPEISAAYKRLADRFWVGGQYDFLPRIARHWNVQNLELAVHVDDRLFEHLRDDVHEEGGVYRLNTSLSSPDMEIFRAFSFPVLMLTKKDMDAIARDRGFLDILELSWFCHTPRNGKPCGTCNPCLYTIEEGLGRRVPLRSRIRRRLRPLKQMLSRQLHGLNLGRFRRKSA